MGYPMTWKRFVSRNGLTGNYDKAGRDLTKCTKEQLDSCMKMINGDMRRLEQDTLGEGYLAGQLAEYAEVDEGQCRRVLEAFFGYVHIIAVEP